MTKAELQKTIDELNADNNECLVLLDEYMYRQRIIENLINLKDLSKLKGMYLFTKQLIGKRDIMANRIQFNDFQKKSVYAKCNGKCAICGKPVKFKKMTIDHITPLSRGGTNDIKNLQLACKRCNSMKSNMTMDDMMGQISEILKYNRKQKLIRVLGGIVE